jgi:peptidoglycan lytic transglycosylase
MAHSGQFAPSPPHNAWQRALRRAGWIGIAAVLAGCAGAPRGPARDGPPDTLPPDIDRIADAQPRVETIRSGGANKPYTVGGRTYIPLTGDQPFSERGLASWYGRQFHGRATATGELYDMYAMTAAHPTMPLPSYARVRNPANGREAIVRINDRGPFHEGRVIDLSYAAARKLGLLRGVAPVELERITYEDIRTGAWRRDGGTLLAVAPTAPRPQPATAGPLPAAAAVADIDPIASFANTATAPAVDEGMPAGAVVLQAVALDATAMPSPLPPAPAAAEPPAPANAVPAAPPQAMDESPSAGFWLQLGAFGQREGAQRLQEQMARALGSLAPRVGVFQKAGMYKVQAGPFASREAARSAADAARATANTAPLVVERR